MSADWFCKIGDNKVGPLNNQQLKTFVAKGQLKPDHLVRRGTEGPWVPAGRVKGLFAVGPSGATQSPDKPAAARPLPKAANAAALPTAAESPPPPANAPGEIPPEPQSQRGRKSSVGKLDIETVPVMVSRRKKKTGLQTLRKSDQKKAKTILACVIGGGLSLGLIVFVWALAQGRFSPAKQEPSKTVKQLAAGDSAAKPPEKKPEEKKSAQNQWPTSWNKVSVEMTTLGDVNVMVLRPSRSAPPQGIKTAASEVLNVPVNLQLKEGAKKGVPLLSWADDKLKKSVFLKDDDKEGKGTNFELLGVVPRAGDDASQIAVGKRVQLHLIFELPVKFAKMMYLALPGAAIHADGTIIAYEFETSDFVGDASKAADPAAPASAASAGAGHKQGAK
jgi:hypothetical protein